MEKILFIEDSAELKRELSELLKLNDYYITCAETRTEALEILKSENIDLILLDNMLPDCMGFDLCEKIRTFYSNPIIFLTVCDREEDIIAGFQKGADDYVTKPFSGRLLLSRIHAHLRRKNQQDIANILYSGELEIHLDSRKVFRNNIEIQLGAIEQELCEILIRNSGKIVKRDVLLDAVWDSKNKFVEDNTLNVHISRLRKKLQYFNGLPYIETVKSYGYRWCIDINGN
ncbi:MAG: response regulator transcription factor [Eubacteriales bacterium]|nr:response regulator transcription factor [Eubacteriales bacterium]